MDDLKQIEAGLERLMPRGLSEDAREKLEQTIDELVAKESDEPSRWRWWRSAAAVAILGAGSALVWTAMKDPVSNNGGTMAAALVPPTIPGVELAWYENSETVSERASFETVWDQGQLISEDGEIRRKWSYDGEEMEEIYFPEAGYTVTLKSRVTTEVFLPVSL